ncbi:aryl-alcohol dehydrogenase, partial [Phenoliferia sp. Uapishka_3]
MGIKTQAYVVAARDAPFLLQEIELEDPEPNEVLVRVKACGVCHTDLAIRTGEFPSPFPTLAGHEGSGKVIQVGSAVTRVKVGDSVLLSFSYCGECGSCKISHPAGCEKFGEMNFGRTRNTNAGARASAKGADGKPIYGTFFGQSSFAKHALVVETSVVRVPSGTDLVMLAPLGCGLQTGAGAVLNLLKPTPTSTIAIFGVGAVGLGAIFAAASLGLATIIVIDVVDSRLELALSVGATHVINGLDKNVITQIKQLTPYEMGTNYAIDATGNTRCLKNAWSALATLGHLVSCGTPGPGHAIPFEIHENLLASKTYTGLSEGDSNPTELYNQGKFPVDRITKTYKLEDLAQAVEDMHSGATIKPVILFD